MKKILWIGWSVVLALATASLAATVSVDFTFAAEDVALVPAGEYVAIGLVGGSRVVDEVGAPAIPARFANVLLPAGARNVRISASGDLAPLAAGIVPYPAQPRRPKSKPRRAFAPANARYASAEPWPADIATFQGDHDMQGYRFVSVRVNPLAYVGAEKKLFLREKVTVTATYDEPIAAKSILPKQAALFGPLVDSLVANPGDAAAFAPAVKTVAPKAALDYLIVTSAALSNAFQRIADYRASAAGGGYTTRVLTTNFIGTTYSGSDIQAKIRACISNSVATLGTTMVLLGGDDTIVPDRDCYAYVPDDYEPSYEYEMPTDLYYSGLSGSWNSDGDARYGETNDGVDMAWDVVVGRLPMRTAEQVTNYLNKVMTYESGSPATNKIILGGPYAWDTYTSNNRPSDDVTVDGHAGFRSTSPAHDSVSDSEAWLRRLYRDGIRSNWPAQVGLMCDTITSWDGSTCGDHLQSAANTVAAFNRNWTHLMFSGHGEPQGWGLESGDFTHASASGLTGLTAFVYTDACLTGHFDKNSNTIDGYPYTTEPCLGENFLRNARPLGGALAYMGCARYGWGEPDAAPADNAARGGPSTEYAYKFYRRMYETTNRTLGTAFAMHKADMIGLSGTYDCERWIQFGMNLLGDPALKMPGGVPAPSAPSFAANPGPLVATVGVARAFTVSAAGNPAPGLALQGQTASAGYSFVPATGVLTYTAPGADLGARTFTFRATNTLGAATQTVSVTVVAPPPTAPASIWASATNATDFTAAWSAVSGATSYRLDVGTNATFTGPGGVPVPGTLASHDGTLGAGTGGTWTETGLTQGSGYLISQLGDELITPALDFSAGTAETLTFKARTYGGAVAANNEIAVSISTDNGANWTSLGSRTPLNTTLTAMAPFDLSGYAGSQVKVKLATPGATASVGAGIDDVLITNLTGGASAFFISGYSNRTVAGTSQSVTGLTAETTYYFQVRAVNETGTSGNTSVASIATRTSGGVPAPLPIVNATMTAGGAMSMEIATTAGISYALQSTTNLIPPVVWQPVATTNGTGAAVTLQDSNSTDPARYYRIVKP
jgi:hypothetical protein